MKIGVIFPSRGLAFSQTCEELIDNLDGYDHEIYFSHGRPIPDCFNKPIARALRDKQITHIWVVEDDMLLPKDTLKTLLAENVPAVACNYPLTKEGRPAVFSDPDGNAIYCGTGCLLVTREFLAAYKRPIFKTGIGWDIKIKDTVTLSKRLMGGEQYGLHDVTFSVEAYKRGAPIKVSSLKCGQRKLTRLGGQSSNQGQHEIETWTYIKPQEVLPKLSEQNRNVTLKDGTLVFMDINRAKLLEKEGKATIHPLSYVGFE